MAPEGRTEFLPVHVLRRCRPGTATCMKTTDQRQRYGMRRLVGVILCLWAIATMPDISRAEKLELRDLSDGQQAAVYAASAAAFGLGKLLPHHMTADDLATGYVPPAIDRTVRRWFHGGEKAQTNFLDSNFGSGLSPAAALAGLSAMDINRREFSRDIPFFISGLVATKGITDLSKGLFRRPRPCCVAMSNGDYTDNRNHANQSYSFFSGHASSVFFTATFVNRRFRRHMRQNWTDDEYRLGRVLSPVLSFSWATFVGMSRVQADRHYFTDVAAGALAGAILGEVFYRLAYETDENSTGSNTTPLFLLRIPLN